jgi:hypothetical protein
MPLRLLVLTLVLVGASAFGQDAGDTPDGGLPDGSMGMGGADMNSQETGDGTENTVCAANRDCERGFTCTNNKCHYSGIKVASCAGCGGGASAALLFPVVVALRWRRRKHG